MDNTTTIGKHTKPVPQRIRYHLENQPSSGKTIEAYCKEAGFSAWTFYNWRKKYSDQINATPHGKPSRSSSSIQPLPFTTIGTVRLQESSQPLFDIRFPTGTVISVYGGTDAGHLAPFLSLLSGDRLPC